MRLTRTTKIDATAADVWALFAHRFEDADQWMASAPRSYGQSGARFEGATSGGRIIEMRPDGTGMKASERFMAYDEAATACTVRVEFIAAPRLFPIDHNSLDFSVVETGTPHPRKVAALEKASAAAHA